MAYTTFIPSYYSHLVKTQQAALANDNLFWFAADGVSSEAVANTANKTIKDEQIILNQIMYGGRVLPTNMIPMLRRIDWQSGKVFEQYSSTNPSLADSDFYCIASNRAIYKCIFNNNGAQSTYEPNSIVPGRQTLADGYIWQYMYRLTPNQLLEFAVGQFIPIIEDTDVVNAAIKGTVSTIHVDTAGNYPFIDSGTVTGVVSPTVYKIREGASSTSGTYNNMGFACVAGSALGEVRQIVQYTANTSGRFVQVDQPIAGIDLTTQYDIAPYVRIEGNGSGATARSIVNSTQLTNIQVLNPGLNYTLATATLESNTNNSTAATASPNLSPLLGHGGDPLQELYVDTLLISVNMDNYTIPNGIPVNDMTFSRVGLVRHLKTQANNDIVFTGSSFSNIGILDLVASSGTFNKGDVLHIVGSENPTAQIVHVGNDKVYVVYRDQFVRFPTNAIVQSQDGSFGTITNVIQPQVSMADAALAAIVNTDTIQRSENSREEIQILIKIR